MHRLPKSGREAAPLTSALTLVAAFAVLGLHPARAQSPAAPQPAQAPAPPPCSASPQPTPCTNPDKGNATDRFPFPGEKDAAPDAVKPAPDAPAPSTVQSQPANPEGKKPAEFPFPGEDTPSSSSSSSSSDSNAPDSDAPTSGDTKDKAAPEGRRLLKRVNPIGTKLQSPEEREVEDLDVAKFYTQTGNLQGAYMRSQDAVKIAPNDADAHCSLAEAALKLNKRDEAVSEFNACLKLDPEEKLAKNARKELAKLK